MQGFIEIDQALIRVDKIVSVSPNSSRDSKDNKSFTIIETVRGDIQTEMSVSQIRDLIQRSKSPL